MAVFYSFLELFTIEDLLFPCASFTPEGMNALERLVIYPILAALLIWSWPSGPVAVQSDVIPVDPPLEKGWYADFTSVARNEQCEDVEIDGRVGPIPGKPPFTFEINACSPVVACGLNGRGIRITSSDGYISDHLVGAGFVSWEAEFNYINPPVKSSLR